MSREPCTKISKFLPHIKLSIMMYQGLAESKRCSKPRKRLMITNIKNLSCWSYKKRGAFCVCLPDENSMPQLSGVL